LCPKSSPDPIYYPRDFLFITEIGMLPSEKKNLLKEEIELIVKKLNIMNGVWKMRYGSIKICLKISLFIIMCVFVYYYVCLCFEC